MTLSSHVRIDRIVAIQAPQEKTGYWKRIVRAMGVRQPATAALFAAAAQQLSSPRTRGTHRH
jgi:hypothetical protein